MPSGPSTQDIRDLESEPEEGFYRPSGDEDQQLKDLEDLYNAPAYNGPRKTDEPGKSSARSRLKKLSHSKLFWGGGAAVSAILGFLMLIIILLGTLKVPQLAEHIFEYQFARLSRNFGEHTAVIEAEDTALSTADKNALQAAFDKYSQVKDATWGSMWDKINNFRPNKIVDNLQETGTLDFEYSTGNWQNLWKKKLTAVVIDGNRIPYDQPSLWDQIVHPLEARSDRIAFSDSMNEALSSTLASRSSIIRSAVAKSIQDQLGISLQWWKQLTKYSNTTPEEADTIQQQEAVAQINDTTVAPSAVSQIGDAESEAQQAEQQCLEQASCAEQTVKDGGTLPQSVLDVLSSAASSDAFQKAVSLFSPTYAVGVPLCMIYDGSIDNPNGNQGKAIDNTSTEDQRAFYAVETAADQEKYGNVNGEAVGAMNWKVGDISQSIAEERASGINTNTNGIKSPQSSGDGSLGNTTTILDFLPSPFNSLGNALAGSACPLVTNIWTGVGAGLAGIIAGFFSGGTSTEAEDGLGNALVSYIRNDVLSQVFAKKELAKLGVIAAGTAGLTIYAKMLVAEKSGVANSGLATGSSFDNDADAGGNLNANEIARQYYARPLTDAEVCATNGEDQVYIADQNSHKSIYNRYLAISNPNSLLTRVGTLVSSQLGSSVFSDISNLGNKIFSPSSALGDLFNIFNPAAAFAAGNCGGQDNQDYGIVQWGWSNDEESLIKNKASYEPIENQSIIESATYDGQPAVQAIANKYNVCFGYNPDGTPNSQYTMGYLLSQSLIKRDSNGNVIADQGLCSPDNLSYDSPDSSAYDPQDGLNDLIFRYRLEKNYELTVDQLEAEQNASISE